jgi:monovalent cation:proton antiporter-2 (CPA2) family protein
MECHVELSDIVRFSILFLLQERNIIMTLFVQLLIILFATMLAGALSVKLGQPAVLGKLLIGILLGPALLGFIEKSEIIDQISEIGVLLLMFIAGLETDVDSMKQNRNSSVAVALGGIILPFAGGYASGLLMGFDMVQSIFLGLLLSATSVSISVQTLKELGQLKSRESTTILGAAIVDDIVVVVLLAVMMSFVSPDEVSLSIVLGKKVLFFVVIIFFSWKAIPWIMKKLAPLHVAEAVIVAALIVCFGYAWFAEYLGVAGIIGAFAAGLAISQTPYKKQVEHKIEPIAFGIFVPVFFVSIGISVSFMGLADQLWFIAGLSIIAIATKLVGAWIGARLTGFNNQSSLIIGAGMISRGEVALILAVLGLEMNLLATQYFTSIVIVVIISTLLTPPMLKYFYHVKNRKDPSSYVSS